MQCLDDLTVLDYVEGRMGPQAMTEVQQHLDGCTECVTLVGQMTEERSRKRMLCVSQESDFNTQGFFTFSSDDDDE